MSQSGTNHSRPSVHTVQSGTVTQPAEVDGIAAAASVIVVSPILVRFRLSSSFDFRVYVRAPCVCVRERERAESERVFAGVGGQFVSLCFAVSHVFFKLFSVV